MKVANNQYIWGCDRNAQYTMTQIINMTPHAITLGEMTLSSKGESFFVPMKTIEASGKTIRLKASTVPVFKIEDSENFAIQISKTVFGEPVGLPDYAEGIYYIVSQIVKTAFPERLDLLVPAEIQRDASGQIVGCLSLGQ
jgi:hypothetical protein